MRFRDNSTRRETFPHNRPSRSRGPVCVTSESSRERSSCLRRQKPLVNAIPIDADKQRVVPMFTSVSGNEGSCIVYRRVSNISAPDYR